ADQRGRDRWRERYSRVTIASVPTRPHPSKPGGDRVQTDKSQKQERKYQGALDAGPQKRDRQQLDVTAAHPMARVKIDQKDEDYGSQHEAPSRRDPAA